MEDILSEIDNTKSNKPAIFSKLAFWFAILAFVLFTALCVNIYVEKNNKHRISFDLSGVLSMLVLFCMIGGIIFSIISLVRKEKIKYIKTIAAIINLGLFVLLLVIMIFSIMSDWNKMKQN